MSMADVPCCVGSVRLDLECCALFDKGWIWYAKTKIKGLPFKHISAEIYFAIEMNTALQSGRSSKFAEERLCGLTYDFYTIGIDLTGICQNVITWFIKLYFMNLGKLFLFGSYELAFRLNRPKDTMRGRLHVHCFDLKLIIDFETTKTEARTLNDVAPQFYEAPMRIKTTDGVELHVEEAGSGTPILFLHGFATDHSRCEPPLRHFSRRHRCIAYATR